MQICQHNRFGLKSLCYPHFDQPYRWLNARLGCLVHPGVRNKRRVSEIKAKPHGCCIFSMILHEAPSMETTTPKGEWFPCWVAEWSIMENMQQQMWFHYGIWCWSLLALEWTPIFISQSIVFSLYSIVVVGVTGPPLSTNWSGRVLQAISSVMLFLSLAYIHKYIDLRI